MSGRASSPTVLAVTAQRPEEVVGPLAEIPWRTETLTLDASRGPIERCLGAARQTRRALDAVDPDLILLDCLETIGAPVTFVARRREVPVVVRLVGDPWRKLEEERIGPARARRDVPEYLRHRVSHGLNEYVFRNASGFVTVSRDLAAAVERRTSCPRRCIRVVPVPVTDDVGERGSAAAARAALGIDQDDVILTVTNLLFRAKLRGVQAIVEDIAELLAADGDLAYVVAGGGDYHGEFLDWLDDTIESPDVRRRIYAPGYVDDVADLYALGDVFAYVSYLDGYPKAVLEAQTARLPVVANDAHGMRDQITDGETGYLVDPSEPGSVRDPIAFLLANPDERTRLGERGRERAIVENSHDAVGRRLAAVLGDLCDEFGTRSAVRP